MKNLLTLLMVATLSTTVACARPVQTSARVRPQPHTSSPEKPSGRAGTVMARAFNTPGDFKDGSAAGSPTKAARRAAPA